MLSLILVSILNAHAMDPAADFTQNMLTQGEQILTLKSDTQKAAQFCALVKNGVDTARVADNWLGPFTASPDKAGVAKFRKLVPSVIVGKLMLALNKSGGGTFAVEPTQTDRGNGTIEVVISVHTNSGNPYQGKAVVAPNAKAFKLVDIEYQSFSAVDYLAKDYQRRMTNEAAVNPKTAVSEVNKQIVGEASFVKCP
jgi:hypothetical protein